MLVHNTCGKVTAKKAKTSKPSSVKAKPPKDNQESNSGFRDLMSPEDAERYDANWQKNASDFNTPGLKITHYKEHNGTIEKSVVIYDDFGRQKWRIDYSNHGYNNHSVPHLHERIYSSRYDPRKGKETRYDIWNK